LARIGTSKHLSGVDIFFHEYRNPFAFCYELPIDIQVLQLLSFFCKKGWADVAKTIYVVMQYYFA